MRPPTTTLLPAVLLVPLLAACGGDADADSPSTDPPQATAAGDPSSVEDSAQESEPPEESDDAEDGDGAAGAEDLPAPAAAEGPEAVFDTADPTIDYAGWATVTMDGVEYQFMSGGGWSDGRCSKEMAGELTVSMPMVGIVGGPVTEGPGQLEVVVAMESDAITDYVTLYLVGAEEEWVAGDHGDGEPLTLTATREAPFIDVSGTQELTPVEGGEPVSATFALRCRDEGAS